MTHNISGQQAPPQPSQPAQQKNTIGTVALIISIIGFIFACIPGAFIVGWIALPIAFILSLVALFSKGKKGAGIAALIISIIGTVVGFLVFLVVVVDAVDEAFSDGDTSVSTPDDSTAEADDAEEASTESGDVGTRTNPHPLGSTIENDDWSVTIHGVDLDATATVMAENQFNDEPAEGSIYILVDVTATYLGDNDEGDTPWVSVDYVTPGGNTISWTDSLAVAPDPFDSLQTLYNGASVRGNFLLEIPSEAADQGVLAVSPSMFGDTVFIAVS